MKKLTCRVRKYRKSAHLSQRELVALLGLKSQGSFSEVEAGQKRPSATVVLACEIVFGVPAGELFPGIYAEGERMARTGLRELSDSRAKEVGVPTAGLVQLAKRLGVPLEV